MNIKHWKHNFFTIWSGQAVSLITSAVLQMAIVWHLTTSTGSAMILSIATMIGFLPQAILGSIIGVLVDRWNRKAVMIAADIIISLSGFSLMAMSFVMDVPILAIMIILFIRSLGTAFHSPAISAVTPLLVPEEELTRCAGYSQSIQSLSYILGPALAAFIYVKWGLNAAIILDIFGAIIACITVAIVDIPKLKLEKTAKGNFINEMKEGYCVIKENKGLVALLWIGALYTLVFMPINALFPLMTMNYFGGTTTHASIVEITFALGMLGGSMLLSVLGGFSEHSISIIGSMILMGIALVISGILPENGFIIFAFSSLLMGFSSPFYSGIQMAIFQEQIEPEFLGRAFGLLGSIMSFAMPLGLIFSGLFADKIGVNIWFALSGICILCIAVLAAILPSFRNVDITE